MTWHQNTNSAALLSCSHSWPACSCARVSTTGHERHCCDGGCHTLTQTHSSFTHLKPRMHTFSSRDCLPISSLAVWAKQLRVGGVTQLRISQPSSRSARSTTIKTLLPLEGGQKSKFTAVHSSLQPHPSAFSVCVCLSPFLSLSYTHSFVYFCLHEDSHWHHAFPSPLA